MYRFLTKPIFLCVLAVSLAVQVHDHVALAQEPAPAPAVDREKVLVVVQQLSHRRFKVRQNAEEELWAMGPAIEEILIKALVQANLETRERIGLIREKFELGITPATPIATRNWIVAAINARSDREQREATGELAKIGSFKTVLKVLNRLETTRQRGDYVSMIMSQTRGLKPSAEQDDFHFDLLRLGVNDPNPTDAARLIGHVLRASQVRQRAAQVEWITKFVDLVGQCPTAIARRTLINGIYFDSSVLREKINKDLLVKWIDLVADEPDRKTRYRYVSKILSTSALIASYGGSHSSSSRSVSFKIDEVYHQLSPEGRNALVDTAANVPAVLAALHEKVGQESLLKAAAQTKEQTIRGNLIGRLAALPDWSSDSESENDVLSLITNEPNEIAQQQIVTGYVQGLGRQPSTTKGPDQQILQSIWTRLMTADDQAWQLNALVETYSVSRDFGSMQDKATIEKMFRCVKLADATDLQTFAYAPISKKHLAEQLKQHRMAFSFIKMLNDLPAAMNMGARFSSLLGSSQFTNAFHDRDERVALLAMIEKQADPRSRRYAVSGLLRNKTLLTQLLEEDQFSQIKKTLIASADKNNAGDALGKFFANEVTIAYLVANSRIDEVLGLEGHDLSETGREQLLMQLVGSDAAVTALLDAGQYDTLLKSVYKVANETRRRDLLRRLVTRKAYARVLAQNGSLGSTLLKLSFDKNWLSSRGYVNLVANVSLKDLDKEPRLALAFWDFAMQLPKIYDRRECVKALFGSDWFLHQIEQNGQFGRLIDDVSTTMASGEYRHAISAAISKTNVTQFLNEERLRVLLRLCEPLQATDRASTFRSLGYLNEVRVWLGEQGNAAILLKELGMLPAQTRGEFATPLFAAGALSKLSDSKAIVPELVAFTNRLPPDFKIEMTFVLLSQSATYKEIENTELLDFVVKQLSQEKIDYSFIRKVVMTSTVLRKLQAEKKSRLVIDRGFEWPTPKGRDVLRRAILFSSYLQPYLTEAELKTAIQPFFDQPEIKDSDVSLLTASNLLFRLVKIGYFDQLRTIIDGKHSNSAIGQSRQWMFYSHPLVIEKMKALDPKADTLARLLKSTQRQYMYSRLSGLFRNETALEWLLDGQGIAPIASGMDLIDVRQRSQLIRPMFAVNYPRMKRIGDGFLKQLVQIDSVQESLIRDVSFVMMLSSSSSNIGIGADVYLPLLKKAVSTEKETSRRVHLLRVLQTSRLQSDIFKAGDGPWLQQLLLQQQHEATEDPDVAKQNLRSSLSRSTGLFAVAIRNGDFDTVDDLLSELVNDDVGKLRLIRFRMLRSQFQPATQYAEPEFSGPKDALRYRFYRLRSEGQSEQAKAVASELGDAGLVWAMELENHDFERLAGLAVPLTKQMPVPPFTGNINPLHRRVEELGYRIVAKQLAGLYPSTASEDADIEELTDWVATHSIDVHLPRYAADALLSANRPQAALSLLDNRMPRRAFYWHWERLDFDRALQVIGWSPKRCDQLFDSIAGVSSNGVSDATAITEPNRIKARDYLLQVAMMAKAAGKSDDINAIMNTLRSHAAKGMQSKARERHLVSLAGRMHQLGFARHARETFAEFSSDLQGRSSYFLSAYQSLDHRSAWQEANQWWDEFAKRHSDETAIKRLERIDGVMNAKTPREQLGAFPKNQTKFFGNQVEGVDLETVPVTHFRYGNYSQAREITSQKQLLASSDWVLIARTHLGQKNYALAAEAFHQSWQRGTTGLSNLYMAGDCWQKAGDLAKARKFKQQARLMAIVFGREFRLAGEIQREGLMEDAMQIYRNLMKTSAPAHKVLIGAVSYVAGNSVTEKPISVAQRLRLWQEHDLYHLRPIQYHTNLRLWVHHAARRHALRAELAVENDDFKRAKMAWKDMGDVTMGNTRLIAPIIEKLVAKDQDSLADEIYQTHLEFLTDHLKRYPGSPAIQEHLAVLKEIRQPASSEESNR